MTSYTFRKSIYRDILSTEIREKYIPRYTRYMTPYDRAWDMGSYTEYMWVYDGICHVVRIPDVMVYERRESAQVLYIVPVSSILGRLPLVPVGDTGTIPFQMLGESADFPGASCDKTQGGRDGCRWWYVNSWALSWGTKQ